MRPRGGVVDEGDDSVERSDLDDGEGLKEDLFSLFFIGTTGLEEELGVRLRSEELLSNILCLLRFRLADIPGEEVETADDAAAAAEDSFLSFCEFSDNILITLPKVNRLLLIAAPSFKRSVPTVPAAVEFSDPAKSIKFNLLVTV